MGESQRRKNKQTYKYIIISCGGNMDIKIKDTKMPLGEKYMKTLKKGCIIIYMAKASRKNFKKHFPPP